MNMKNTKVVKTLGIIDAAERTRTSTGFAPTRSST